MIPPNSVIEKWLHHDKNFTYSDVSAVLDVDSRWYVIAIRAPWDFITPSMMEKLSVLVDKPLPEVFWACWMRPEHMTEGDEGRLRAISALNKAGII